MSFFQKFIKKPGEEQAPAAPATRPASPGAYADPLSDPGLPGAGAVAVEEEAPPPPPREEPVRVEIDLPSDYSLDDLLRRLVAEGGSDLHLSVGCPPIFRVHGDLHYSRGQVLTNEHAERILFPIIPEDKQIHFQQCGNLDFSYEIEGVARFRGNYFVQHRGLGAVFRIIPSKIPTVDELNLPPVLKKIAMIPSGLVVVTGPTGSGKSTTLAAMINHINQNRRAHIITIEDPVEFTHPSLNCLIDHREVGEHAVSFADALRAALREDPDIVLVGEMRDLDTIYNAIKAAETGALVFGTLHTNSAAKTIDRIIDVFPAKQQEQIRAMLSESFKACVAQLLLKKAGGKGRVAVHEILIAETGFGNLIREGKTQQINNYIQTGREHGMQRMDQALLELLKKGVITKDTVREKCHDPNYFRNAGFPLD